MQIYLDSCATTAPRMEVINLMQEILQRGWGNPSSLHRWGERATLALEKARWQVASFVNAPSPDSIIFTSGGTEADNLAVFGITSQYATPQHIIISAVEHSAIALPAQMLEDKGWQVTRLPVNRKGRVNPQDLAQAIQDNTVLVSIIYGQSEVGTIQPIKELATIAKNHGVLFHTDAVQVAGRLTIDVEDLGVDLLSLSAHKYYGIQGAGALYIRAGVKLEPSGGGGGQEKGIRSGTQALGAIASMGLASHLAQQELESENLRLRELRDYLFELLSPCPYLTVTGDLLHRLPHHASFLLNHDSEQLTGRKMVRELNFAGIGISAGSACNSGKSQPSNTLVAMGYSKDEAVKGIRISLDRHTTKEDIQWTAMVIEQVIQRII
ncbi:cysteine desulfurase family protein [Cyanobacterium sp. IPPAS B-1200]|uniref:cysteine desulfurase family protein n=1 Tax=Cyanobacterium sp. IPPAS B-1200 TaxID=1562720 RepID=UPI0008526341|nr:cysteine desulfurase family protein [Cyanobacterium sp. IPPAS B-1200]OEJ79153.1 cysteine desulfurase [Cyanobacterium sp. IPPAS B-1200]